ncbi:MAG: chromosomal replication initiator DnaA [Caulobacterales bacterium]|nr:chromosomal replication initiator DnaA [Caulobacterales bacterium]
MSARREPPPQMRLPLQADRPARASDFVVSDANRAAFDRLAVWPDGITSVLALGGPPGSGKSRLAALWAERVGAVALHGSEAAQIDPLELEGRPVLLDHAPDADDETLFHLFNLARAPGGALLLVARSAPVHWACALPDLRSRLDATPVVTLATPDDAVLTAMLRARFAERSITPSDDLIAYLLRRIDRSAQAAADVVERLSADPRPATRATAREVLEATTDDLPL